MVSCTNCIDTNKPSLASILPSADLSALVGTGSGNLGPSYEDSTTMEAMSLARADESGPSNSNAFAKAFSRKRKGIPGYSSKNVFSILCRGPIRLGSEGNSRI